MWLSAVKLNTLVITRAQSAAGQITLTSKLLITVFSGEWISWKTKMLKAADHWSKNYFETSHHEAKTRPSPVAQHRQRGAEVRIAKYKKVITAKDKIINIYLIISRENWEEKTNSSHDVGHCEQQGSKMLRSLQA